ncbi:hypothetical protein CDL12_27980 [Handroanthus impetiginosus]|uniref:Ubiquitinyl hydrolase 1 n=1 Tax=Handroanthus impetiginosus TaxID=429701 RepID=A0A2G9G2I0_9LAMI|nr:hypothetical protein CDL12_27980 [Handroanthus impetiginosus]
MRHCYILISRPRDEEVCRGRRKSKEIPQRLHCWVDAQKLIEFFRLYRWGECKLPNKVYDAEDSLKSITAEMVFEFNPTSQELCLLNPNSAVAAIVRAKDLEIKELKKRVAELEAVANKDLCVLAPAKTDAAATKEQCDCGAAYEEMDEERKDDEDEEKEEKAEEDEQKEEKMKEGQDDKKGEKEDSEDEKRNEKEGGKEEERKDGDDDVELDHDANNEYNDMNEENQTKHRASQVSCHHEVEINRKFEVISQKLDFGQDVNFGGRDYEAVCILSSIIDDLKLNVKTFEKYN